jgi:hypothetical protein
MAIALIVREEKEESKHLSKTFKDKQIQTNQEKARHVGFADPMTECGRTTGNTVRSGGCQGERGEQRARRRRLTVDWQVDANRLKRVGQGQKRR